MPAILNPENTSTGSEAFNTPILLIIFNRLGATKKVFEAIRHQKPKYFFVAADGPRPDKEGDIIKCSAAREAIQVDWDCEFHTLYRKENRGCGLGPAEAITWFFQNVDEGIILEDDCLPHPDFFMYCNELLDRFRNNKEIFFIGGTNFQKGIKRGKVSYYFSAGNQGTWGWATWKRSWEKFDYQLKNLDSDRLEKSIHNLFWTRQQHRYWMEIFEKVKKDQFGNSCWDYQFYFSGWANGCLAVIPNNNMVSNIGFDDDATHTKGVANPLMNMCTNAILPLKHPDKIYLNKKADLFLHKNFIQSDAYGYKRILKQIRNVNKKLKNLLRVKGGWFESFS